MWGLSCIMIAHAVYIEIRDYLRAPNLPAVALLPLLATLPEVPLPNERMGAELTEAETLR